MALYAGTVGVFVAPELPAELAWYRGEGTPGVATITRVSGTRGGGTSGDVSVGGRVLPDVTLRGYHAPVAGQTRPTVLVSTLTATRGYEPGHHDPLLWPLVAIFALGYWPWRAIAWLVGLRRRRAAGGSPRPRPQGTRSRRSGRPDRLGRRHGS